MVHLMCESWLLLIVVEEEMQTATVPPLFNTFNVETVKLQNLNFRLFKDKQFDDKGSCKYDGAVGGRGSIKC